MVTTASPIKEINIVYNLIRIIKLISLTALSFAVSSCSSVEYMDKAQLSSDSLYLQTQSVKKKLPKYGALRYRGASDEQSEGRLFLLSKEGGAYRAETLLKDRNDKKYFLNLGMNTSESMPVIGLRVEF